MPTNDGIPDEDWDVIRDHAEEIVAASSVEANNKLLVSNLARELKRLESKYGRLPSILATEVDYCEDEIKELSLLKEAYITSCEIEDNKNMTLVSASIAEYYIETVLDKKKAAFWLKKLSNHLNRYSDSYHQQVYNKVKKAITNSEKS